jgi:hypothetical protein
MCPDDTTAQDEREASKREQVIEGQGRKWSMRLTTRGSLVKSPAGVWGITVVPEEDLEEAERELDKREAEVAALDCCRTSQDVLDSERRQHTSPVPISTRTEPPSSGIASRVGRLRQGAGDVLDSQQTICGVVCNCGPNGEPVACGYAKHDDGPHSWATLPTWTRRWRIVHNPPRLSRDGKRVLEEGSMAIEGPPTDGSQIVYGVAQDVLDSDGEREER